MASEMINGTDNNDHQTKPKPPHAVLVAYPLQGHVIPAVHLALTLASNGFTITFVNTLSVHHHITNSHPSAAADDIFAAARGSHGGLDIRYATVSDGFPLRFDRSANHDQFWDGVPHVLWAHVDELVGDMVRSKGVDPPVTCLISDTFFTWSSMIAKKYNLVNVSFWTEPALVLNLYYHVDLLIKNGHHGASHENRKDTIDYIPGVPVIEPKDLMSYLQATDTSTTVHRIIYSAFADVKNADFILINTVQELEPDTISALHFKQPTFAVGPIFPSWLAKSATVATSLWPESDCATWLDSKPRGSVLYVSFGSYAHARKRDVEEIAHGLLLSGVGFVWVIRPDLVSSEETDILPGGFLEAVKGKGLVVTWTNQIAVISHPSIGGFLTHCGWNSVLESVWFGVPLLAYPLLTDQFTNRKLVVDDWKIGLNLVDNRDRDQRVTRDEVAEKIGRLMSGKLDGGDRLRNNIKEARKTLENALSNDGSSVRNLKQFIHDVKVKMVQKKCGALDM